MTGSWHSLYLLTDDTAPVAAALNAALTALGYRPYDPFPGGTGTPPGLVSMVRLFVAPVQEGWVRILGQPDEAILPDLSQQTGAPVIYGWLTGEGGGFALFRDGARQADSAGSGDLDAFEPYVRPGQTLDVLRAAFAGNLPVEPVAAGSGDGPPVMVVGADSLPPELQQFAQDRGVDPKKADKILQRLSGNLFGKLARGSGGAKGEAQSDQDAARAMLSGSGGRDLWNSLDGQRLRAAAGVLNLPGNWRVPEWDAVREAYQIHRLRQRSPRMPLMPGDKETMDAVPDALAYMPVYMGRG